MKSFFLLFSFSLAVSTGVFAGTPAPKLVHSAAFVAFAVTPQSASQTGAPGMQNPGSATPNPTAKSSQNTQNGPSTVTKTPPNAPSAATNAPQNATNGASAAPSTAQNVAPATHKSPPAAKTQEEFAAYQAAAAQQDAATAEKAADDFAAKFPQSDLRGLLYSTLMRRYQQTNDSDKTLQMARKVLIYDPNDPVALVMAATVLAERTRDNDLDREERYDESIKYAKKSLETINTDLLAPNNITPEQLAGIKKTLTSMAHSSLGMVYLDRKDDATAAQEFQQSISLSPPGEVEPLTYLRLALAQDHLKQYPEALASANKAVAGSPTTSPVSMLAKQEVDRLNKLIVSNAPNGQNTLPAPANPTAPR
jgi:tetratricopeptide (TPR) repeat protein